MKARSVLASFCLLSLVVACGGATSGTSSSGTSGTTSGGASGTSGGGPAGGCTEVGCTSGLEIAFSFNQPGTYVFDLEIDGQKASCKATIPIPRDYSGGACEPGVQLTVSGSMLPVAQQSLGGLYIQGIAPKSVTLRAMRDATVLGEKTFAPTYTISRPNGPNCEPVCNQASAAFP